MAITETAFGGGRFRRFVETGTANTAYTFTTPGRDCRVLYATTAYSATPTQAGVTHDIDSGAGAGYDATLSTGTANARYTFFQPTAELKLVSDDAFKVTAPAGGAGITAAVVVVVELL